MSIPEKVPARLIAGDTWAWTSSLSDYEAPTWTATIYFENSAKTFNAAASASGSDHAFSIAAATTEAYKAGRYRWSIRVTDGTTVATAESGWLDVVTNPASDGTHDPRLWARRTLDNLLSFLEENAATSQASFSYQGRSAARWDIDRLLQWQKELEARVRTEEFGAAAAARRTIKLRFGRG